MSDKERIERAEAHIARLGRRIVSLEEHISILSDLSFERSKKTEEQINVLMNALQESLGRLRN